MIEIAVPGGERLELAELVLDYNGTLARDGELIAGVADDLAALAESLRIHVVTADTFGKARDGLAGIPCALTVLPPDDQARAKRRFVEGLGAAACACIGNGRNDRDMLAAAGLGIAVLGPEGAAMETLAAADVVAPDIGAALGLLRQPLRLVATLRS